MSKTETQLFLTITPNLELRIQETWFAIFFDGYPQKIEQIILKPLNEKFYHQINKTGAILTFNRSLIEEDDPEYALDVLNLFNLTPSHCFPVSKELNHSLQLTLQLLKQQITNSSLLFLRTVLKVLQLQLIEYQKQGFIDYELNQKRVYLFLQLMEQHYIKQQNPDFYASKLGISSKRLNQILKEKLDQTAKQLIQQRLITEIQRFLLTDNFSFKEICFHLNFQSMSNFTRFFKRKTGQTPSSYQKKLKTRS